MNNDVYYIDPLRKLSYKLRSLSAELICLSGPLDFRFLSRRIGSASAKTNARLLAQGEDPAGSLPVKPR